MLVHLRQLLLQGDFRLLRLFDFEFNHFNLFDGHFGVLLVVYLFVLQLLCQVYEKLLLLGIESEFGFFQRRLGLVRG